MTQVLSICLAIATPVCANDDPPYVIQTVANYADASAEVVAQTVAAPIEQQLNGMEGLLRLESVSADGGAYRMTAVFDPKVDQHRTLANVRNRVALAQPLLPADVRTAGITTKEAKVEIPQPTCEIVLVADDDQSSTTLGKVGAEIVERLRKTKPTLNIASFPGPPVERLETKLDREKCLSLGVSLDSALKTIKHTAATARIEDFRKLSVENAQGENVELQAIATFQVVATSSTILRIDCLPAVRLQAKVPLEAGHDRLQILKTWEAAAKETVPPGIRVLPVRP
ncbi:MAG: efflux RND transporter permease subunit [Pirellulales bacterium]